MKTSNSSTLEKYIISNQIPNERFVESGFLDPLKRKNKKPAEFHLKPEIVLSFDHLYIFTIENPLITGAKNEDNNMVKDPIFQAIKSLTSINA